MSQVEKKGVDEGSAVGAIRVETGWNVGDMVFVQ